MKEITISFLSVILIFGLISCASIQDEVTNLEQSCEEGKKFYKDVKPKLDRDFKLLFGSKNGEIDTGVESTEPGIQDIVYARFDTFSDDRKEKLIDANKEAIKIFNKYQILTKKIEKRGPQVCESFKKLKNIANKKQVTKNGLELLGNFIKIAGPAVL